MIRNRVFIFFTALTLFSLISTDSYAKEHRIISTEVANVRLGPGKNFEAIDQVKKGKIIEVLEEKENWIKFTLSDGNFGWVNKNLTDPYLNEKSSEEGKSSSDSILTNPCCYIPIILVILAAFFGIMQSRCPNCGKFYAGRKIGEENLGIGNQFDSTAHKLRTYQYFNMLLQCKYCGCKYKMRTKREL